MDIVKENETEFRYKLIRDITVNRIKIAENKAKGFDKEAIKKEEFRLNQLEKQIKKCV